jgi:FG-GAP repeat
VAIGAPESCRDFNGRAFVVFGRPTSGPVDLDQLGTRGFEVISSPDFKAGSSLSAAGDVNGDGLADLALGDEDYRRAGRRAAGAVVLVYGRAGAEAVRLRDLGPGGFRWVAPEGFSEFGHALAGLGDFDGDGRPDLLAAAPLRAADAGGAWILPQP